MRQKTRQKRLVSDKRLRPIVHPKILISIAIKNLLQKRLRTALTIGGIVIGIGAMVFLVSLSEGLRETVNEHVIGSQSVKTIDVTSPDSTTLPLDLDRTNKIKDIANVETVSSAYIMPGKISVSGSLTDAVLYGTDSKYISLSTLKITEGKGELKSSYDAIISSSLLSLIGQSNSKDAIGQKIKILTEIPSNDGSPSKKFDETLNIVGVADIGSGVAVYMNGKLLQEAGATAYGQTKVVVTDQAAVPSIRNQIAGLGLSTASPLDTIDEINTIFTIFTYVVVGFGGIGMVIAILGMFNTLTISLLERTSEIGLMITMGSRKADVQRLMVTEALILSVLGGIGGILGAWIVGLIIDSGLTYFANNRGVEGTIQVFMMTPLLIVGTLIFVLLIGFAVAFYPSRRAAKINPIDALRHE